MKKDDLETALQSSNEVVESLETKLTVISLRLETANETSDTLQHEVDSMHTLLQRIEAIVSSQVAMLEPKYVKTDFSHEDTHCRHDREEAMRSKILEVKSDLKVFLHLSEVLNGSGEIGIKDFISSMSFNHN